MELDGNFTLLFSLGGWEMLGLYIGDGYNSNWKTEIPLSFYTNQWKIVP